MTQDIRTAIDRLVAVQRTLSISAPITSTLRRVYPYPPRQSGAIECPCIINAFRLSEEQQGPGQVRRQYYTDHIQLFVDDADQNRGLDIAAAYLVALLDVLDVNIRLGGAVQMMKLRGRDPTLASLQWANLPYVGLDLDLDMFLQDTQNFQVGSL